MAHLVTGYAGVEHITSADQGSFNAAFAGDGQFVMDVGSKYSASITSNNNVRVLDGDLLMYGRHVRINPNEYEDLTIQTGTAGKNRVDLICMTYEKNASDGTEIAYLEVLKGTETEGTPSAPSYVNGNILDGATKNQMPLYKATIQGVVLKTLTKMFSVVSTFKQMALQYEAEFRRACQNYLNSLQIEDTLEEILENTQANQLAGALGVKELAEEVPMSRGEYEETFDGMPTGLWRVDLATAADGPEATGNAIVLCYQYALQMVCIYEGTIVTKMYVRMGMNVSGIGGYGDWRMIGMEPIILWTGSGAKNATTLTLQENISGFKYYEIIFDVENNTNAIKSTGKIPIDKSATMDGLNSKALLMKRNTGVPSENSIKLNTGYYFSAPNTSGTAYSGACCPIRILGYE